MDVIISGGSVAGLATAHWLQRTGHSVTVIERSPALRQGGVAVDVRGAALEVAAEMGILDVIATNRVSYEDRFDFINEQGDVAATFTPNADFYESPGDLEISRDTLSEILRQAVPDDVEMIFGSSIERLTQDADGVTVEISGVGTRRADLVVGADGLHSRVRQLACGDESEFVRHLGLYVAVLRSCRCGGDVHGSQVFNAPGKMVMLRGDGADCSAIIGFRSDPRDYDYRDSQSQREMVLDAFAGVSSWKVPAVMSELATTDDLYFDSVSQVKMSTWSRGRVVLVGDAGYCASFFSGMGTTLAMVGAHSLAAALVAHGADIDAALVAYTTRMRPVVDAAHAMAAGGAAILFPPTAADIEARNAELAGADT
jgi:2-polyprenyl-6-methoxyphenol hydroxylase-like FAD-dependent oxidoreductase